MFKITIFSAFIFFSIQAFSEDSTLPNFEAELRALETNQMKTEELQMRNADAVTDIFTDEVGTGQAGILRSTVSALDLDNSDTDVIVPQTIKPRERRIRSR